MPKLRSHLLRIDDYPAHLNEQWEKHKTSKLPGAPTLISTFAGIGGSSLGYSMAGCKELLAVEWDDYCVDVFHDNFPDVPIYHGDIGELTLQQVFDITKLEKGELDIFDGSPPCQGFSHAGKRRLDDDRNQLFLHFVRLLDGLQPKSFVMENVSGLVRGKMKLVFVEILKALKACGYKTSARLLDAQWFGVPQRRARIIILGIREDLGITPTHPVAQYAPIAAEDAIADLPIDDILEFVTEKYRDWWANVPPGKNFTEVHPKGYWYNQQKAHPKKPFPTLTKFVFPTGASGITHWLKPGQLTIPMAKRVQSFPDAFEFNSGDFKQQWGGLGIQCRPF